MVYYRRCHKVSVYFFTVTLKDRGSTLLVDEIDLLRDSMKWVQRKYPYKLKAVSVMPDHLHAIWELPGDDQDYSKRWRLIKSKFTQSLNKKYGQGKSYWQARYWEHAIRNENDLEAHINYIHFNPVKHRLVEFVKDWPYSSFHFYVKKGWLDSGWGDVSLGYDSLEGFSE